MNKQAEPGADNSITRLPIPLIGDVNNRRFMTAVLSGVLGGAGIAAAANLLRSYNEMRKSKSKDTDDETIVLTLPNKAAEDGYTGMRDAKPGESKITAKGGRQFRDSGKYGKSVSDKDKEVKESVKCADVEGNPGPNSIGTIVANALGLTAGGLMSYEVVSRLFDAMNERKLKRKLRAAQESYIDAMTGASKRAEYMLSILNPVEAAISGGKLDKSAADMSDAYRYPVAAYLLALLAGTGATAYVTKKIMDREFPEEKIKKDINKPTRIVFRTAGTPAILEGAAGEEKAASAETCAAITAMLPIYMDVVEGKPNRTLSDPYVKIASAANTDAAGLMKLAAMDVTKAYSVVMRDPKAVWEILKGTKFGLDASKMKAVDIVRETRPETYRKAVDAMIDSYFANGENAGIFRKGWNSIGKTMTHMFADMGGRDKLVNWALTKKSDVSDMISTEDVIEAIQNAAQDQDTSTPDIDEKAVISKAKKGLRGTHKLSVSAADANAARFLRENKAAVRKMLARLNARGSI